ncbi:MAG: SCO family protein [Verrucomicrobiota bacterium]|nr:SCO family protein [Verrucomicrobiota bacterium]
MADRDTKQIIKWSLFGFIIVLVVANFLLGTHEKRTPSGQPVLPVSTNQTALPKISTINPFSLTNQFGNKITLNDMKGRPWLADIIFTRCPTVCPRMTQTLGELRAELPPALRYVSLTTDPGNDTPAVMKAFAEAHGSNDSGWHFLTGPKADLMRLAIDDLKLISVPKGKGKRDNPNDLFVHSSLYILVDAKGRVRKSFEHDATNLLQQVKVTLKQLDAENDR